MITGLDELAWRSAGHCVKLRSKGGWRITMVESSLGLLLMMMKASLNRAAAILFCAIQTLAYQRLPWMLQRNGQDFTILKAQYRDRSGLAGNVEGLIGPNPSDAV